MDEEIYQILCGIIELFDNSKLDGEEIFCFELIKKIIDGDILIESINENMREIAKNQMIKTEEYFQCFNLTIPEELKGYFD